MGLDGSVYLLEGVRRGLGGVLDECCALQRVSEIAIGDRGAAGVAVVARLFAADKSLERMSSDGEPAALLAARSSLLSAHHEVIAWSVRLQAVHADDVVACVDEVSQSLSAVRSRLERLLTCLDHGGEVSGDG